LGVARLGWVGFDLVWFGMSDRSSHSLGWKWYISNPDEIIVAIIFLTFFFVSSLSLYIRLYFTIATASKQASANGS